MAVASQVDMWLHYIIVHGLQLSEAKSEHPLRVQLSDKRAWCRRRAKHVGHWHGTSTAKRERVAAARVATAAVNIPAREDRRSYLTAVRFERSNAWLMTRAAGRVGVARAAAVATVRVAAERAAAALVAPLLPSSTSSQCAFTCDRHTGNENENECAWARV